MAVGRGHSILGEMSIASVGGVFGNVAGKSVNLLLRKAVKKSRLSV